MIDFGVAHDKLAQFESSYDLAIYLIGEGVQGDMEAADQCALSVWMSAQTGERVLVSTGEMWISDLEELDDSRRLHSEAMRDFVFQFDHGEYPDLVRPASPMVYSEDY